MTTNSTFSPPNIHSGGIARRDKAKLGCRDSKRAIPESDSRSAFQRSAFLPARACVRLALRPCILKQQVPKITGHCPNFRRQAAGLTKAGFGPQCAAHCEPLMISVAATLQRVSYSRCDALWADCVVENENSRSLAISRASGLALPSFGQTREASEHSFSASPCYGGPSP
jgi:hypothetical protein